MTKDEATKIKKVINQNKHYTTYYASKTKELRIMVYESNNPADGMKQKAAILNLLNTLTMNGLRPKYRIDFRTYQGFIHCTYVVLY